MKFIASLLIPMNYANLKAMRGQVEWTVVGAGPAGIACIGKLLDAGVDGTKIAWVDPEFKIGDFGSLWGFVVSNTPVESFTKFFQASASFDYWRSDRPPFLIENLPPSQNCPLMLATEPLLWISSRLKQRVRCFQNKVIRISSTPECCNLSLDDLRSIQSKKIILAMGSEPKTLNFENLISIPLPVALHPMKLKKAIQSEDSVAVFGSSESAKTAIQNLSTMEMKKRILFYRSEDSFLRHFKDDESLKCVQCLEMTAANLLRVMPSLTKVIYAIGFEKRSIPIEFLPIDYSYDAKTGEIAPGIYGLGIAFPEIRPYEFGRIEYRVTAIWPFMKRLEKLLPLWMGSAKKVQRAEYPCDPNLDSPRI